jgi:hypothetical protein
MSCQRKNCGCKIYQKKELNRRARQQFPQIELPLEKWECDRSFESTCVDFKPYPPRMTDAEFIVQQDELLSQVPIEFRSKLSYMAYEDGHSAGMEEVIGILRGLVADLVEPIQQFEARIRAENKE